MSKITKYANYRVGKGLITSRMQLSDVEVELSMRGYAGTKVRRQERTDSINSALLPQTMLAPKPE